jgi:hypothetical protein
MQDLQKDLAPESRSEAKSNPKTADEDVFKKHQKNIAIKTLKMSDIGARVMGGMTKEEARDFLKSIGWSDGKIRQLEASDDRSRTAAAGPHTLMEQLLGDFRAGKLADDEMLKRWGHGMGHTKGADYVVGAGEDIIWALLAYDSGRKTKDEVLGVIKANIQQAVRDNEIFKGLRGEERETHDRWMTYMESKRGSISAAKGELICNRCGKSLPPVKGYENSMWRHCPCGGVATRKASDESLPSHEGQAMLGF